MANDILTPEVEAIVNIDDEQVNFVRLRISQEMGEHHDFEVLIDFNTFDETFHSSPEEFMQKTNTKVVIDLQHAGRPETAYVFSGVVTGLKMCALDGMHGGVLFVGQSATIDLERGKRQTTYSNTNLIEILKTITEGTANLETIIEPSWTKDIDFALQYDESDYDFLKRTCAQYKENQYFTGVDLVIGPHREFPVVKLTYDLELQSFEICSRLVPNQFSNYYYQRETHTTMVQDSPADIDNATNLLNIVSRRSDKLTWRRKPFTPSEAFVPDMDGLIEQTKRRKVSEGARMFYARGICKTPDVRIGRILDISMPENMGGAGLGRYRVRKVVHELDQNGRYRCEFEGIQADLQYYPMPEAPLPAPQLIECEVVQNEDPLGMGRIQVSFPFDERICETWIPVMTPDAGGNGAGLGPVGRGYSWLPEKSDTVAVGFLDGPKLAQPVVVGSMFHGGNAANLGGGKGNHIKTITDKTGGQILMNTNTSDAWGITIHDQNGNVINLDTKGKNITIIAPETITLDAENIHLNARKNIISNAGINIQETAGKDILQTASGNIEETADNKKEMVINEYARGAKKSDMYADEIIMSSEKENMILQSAKVVKINSVEKTNLF